MMRETVQHYYGKELQTSADLKTDACCTVDSVPNYVTRLLREKIHPDVRDSADPNVRDSADPNVRDSADPNVRDFADPKKGTAF